MPCIIWGYTGLIRKKQDIIDKFANVHDMCDNPGPRSICPTMRYVNAGQGLV
jgi:hypothetical protein